mgnify:FL=1
MKHIYIFIISFILLSTSCSKREKDFPDSIFSTTLELSQSDFNIEEKDLAQIEGIHCNDSVLIVLDFHSGDSYTLFDINSGKIIRRFGAIGQGPNEIPLGTYGYIEDKYFYLFYDQIGYIGKYSIDSLCNTKSISHPHRLAKYQLEETQLSRAISLNDSIFLGAGTYKSKFQYTLFNKYNNILDYSIEIYNSNSKDFNKYHKFLSNQGNLKKRPNRNQFVYSLNFSSNLDIVEINNNKIHLIKSLHFANPNYQPVSNDNLNRVIPSKENIIGYLDICATKEYIYALYADKKRFTDNKSNNYNSDTILVFDWNGNPIRKLKLTNEAYYICINEDRQMLYAAVKDASYGWSIISYKL